MEFAIWPGLLFPLAGFILLMAYPWQRQTINYIACSTVFLSFICFSAILTAYAATGFTPKDIKLFTWLSVPGIHADFRATLDALSILMTLIITGIGFLIHVYSIGYMDHE